MTNLATLLDHREQFLAFLQRRLHDRAQAEDVLQAAYIRAMQHEGSILDHESVIGWFYRVLRNAVVDAYRRGSTESTALAVLAREMEGAVTPPAELRDEVCRCLDAAVDGLAPHYREVLREVDLADAPLADYASRHGITQNNAAVRAHRARAALRKELLRTCGACSQDHHCQQCDCDRC